jgi:hypothetical protein
MDSAADRDATPCAVYYGWMQYSTSLGQLFSPIGRELYKPSVGDLIRVPTESKPAQSKPVNHVLCETLGSPAERRLLRRIAYCESHLISQADIRYLSVEMMGLLTEEYFICQLEISSLHISDMHRYICQSDSSFSRTFSLKLQLTHFIGGTFHAFNSIPTTSPIHPCESLSPFSSMELQISHEYDIIRNVNDMCKEFVTRIALSRKDEMKYVMNLSDVRPALQGPICRCLFNVTLCSLSDSA